MRLHAASRRSRCVLAASEAACTAVETALAAIAAGARLPVCLPFDPAVDFSFLGAMFRPLYPSVIARLPFIIARVFRRRLPSKDRSNARFVRRGA